MYENRLNVSKFNVLNVFEMHIHSLVSNTNTGLNSIVLYKIRSALTPVGGWGWDMMGRGFTRTLSRPPSRRRSCSSCTPWSSPRTGCVCSVDGRNGDGGDGDAAQGAARGSGARTTASGGGGAAVDVLLLPPPLRRRCRRCSASASPAFVRRHCRRTWTTGPPQRSPADDPPNASRRRRRRRHHSAPTWSASGAGRTATGPGRRPPSSCPAARCSGRPVQTRT